MNGPILARYNFRVLMYRNWWLLVIPVAASQLTVFWNIITQRFSPSIPADSVEMVSPLLAAFLAAHVLSAEYRTGVGAILASKPVGIARVVLLRLLVVIALVWALGLLALAAYYYGKEPYDLWRTALAGVPSTLFLAMLALLFATLLRNPLAGFGVAALYWALDLPPGPPVHPYLSLRTYAASIAPAGSFETPVFGDVWWVAKALLLVGAVVLYLLHARAMFGLGAPLTRRAARRTLAWACALLAVYVVTGATTKVVYGYAHRGGLSPSDAAWFRRQFSSFGPIPATALFGPAFSRYVGEVPNSWRIQQDETDVLGATREHLRDVRDVLTRMPNSIWAPSAAELASRLEMGPGRTLEQETGPFWYIVRRYPHSPYVERALQELGRRYADAGQDEPAREAYDALLRRQASPAARGEALRFLAGWHRRRGDLDGAAQSLQQWAEIAGIQERPTAYVMMAEVRSEQGRTEEARAAARRAIEAAAAFTRASVRGELTATGGTLTKWHQDVAAAEQRAKRF